MKKRRKMSRGKSRRLFRKTALKTHRANSARPARGGIRF